MRSDLPPLREIKAKAQQCDPRRPARTNYSQHAKGEAQPSPLIKLLAVFERVLLFAHRNPAGVVLARMRNSVKREMKASGNIVDGFFSCPATFISLAFPRLPPPASFRFFDIRFSFVASSRRWFGLCLVIHAFRSNLCFD